MYTIKVLFKDSTSIIINNVKGYEIDCKFDTFFVYVGESKIMIPRDVVKMIGRVEVFNEGLKLECVSD